jgi:oligopeptidase B
VIHDEQRTDDYFWLRDKQSPATVTYLEGENAYADAVMKPTEPLQRKLYDEFLSRIKQTDLSVPYKFGDHWYYSRTEEGKQYPIMCRKLGEDGPEQITLDLNVLAEGHSFLGLGVYSVSKDGARCFPTS